MAQLFGCSRVTVTKAIAKLQSRGLVHSRQGDGTFVEERAAAPVGLFDATLLLGAHAISELLEFRMVLEKEIARLAAERMGGDDLLALEGTVARMAAALGEPEAFVSEDVAFHLTLARAGGNGLLAGIYARTQDLLRRQMLAGTAHAGSMERAVESHRRILRALRRRSAEEAVAAVVLHLHDAAEETLGAQRF